jgi:SOS regulatory protein LexA
MRIRRRARLDPSQVTDRRGVSGSPVAIGGGAIGLIVAVILLVLNGGFGGGSSDAGPSQAGDLSSCHTGADAQVELGLGVESVLGEHVRLHRARMHQPAHHLQPIDHGTPVVRGRQVVVLDRGSCTRIGRAGSGWATWHATLLDGIVRALEVIEGGRSRRAAVVELARPNQATMLPLVGEVAAGSPVVAEDRVEDYLAVPDQLASDADFVLTVKGDSMVNAGILDGDLVVVRKQADARDGEIVVALVGDEEATVKRFFRENGRVRLQPENDTLEPMYPDEVQVLGAVKAVLRRL